MTEAPISLPRDRAQTIATRDIDRVRSGMRMLNEWLAVGAAGAVGWPWLLKSLGDGGPTARAALLARTGLDDAALPDLGSWRADADFLNIIAAEILDRRPRTVVELGGGTSTLVAAHCLDQIGGGRLVSIDGSEEFAGETRRLVATRGLDAEVRAAPLDYQDNGWPGAWYAPVPLPDRIDLLIVDGPPWFLHPMVRGAAATLFDRIPSGGTVLLDDAARPGERLVARRWKREWPDFTFERVNNTAGTLVGRRR
ncbi:class I SAM-dependent methyltransferase [Sphingomonas montana]|uniref:class I SAM-dependent methyltransferase n=1 Tax=Sphingomonas montana TaxID=1843236 RepID=UPI0013EA24CA|nr:class I SAM-dependent methyltransferase [Sphingomonas montana]